MAETGAGDKTERKTNGIFIRNINRDLYRLMRARALQHDVPVGELINQAMDTWLGLGDDGQNYVSKYAGGSDRHGAR